MWTLIRFFRKHHMLFLFLLLEGIAIFLLVQNNYVQRISFVKATNLVSGALYEQINDWRDYLHLKEVNRQLTEENIKLRGMLPGTFYAPDTAHFVHSDSLGFRRYTYSSAKVVNNTVNKQYNFITLNKGKEEGVAPDMAVIGPDGIAGIVYGVSDHFSTVISVINRNFRVSTKFKKNNFYGSLTWDGRSYRRAVLNEIPLHAPVEVGDSLVVTGFSDSFPEGIPVGTVAKAEQKDGRFFTIEVLLFTDFRSLEFVTIIDDLMKTERESLEKQIMEEQ